MLGQTVTFTATVTASGVNPTGSVLFFDGATLIGSAALSSGKALFSTSSLAVGTHSITAEYDGDAKTQAATSGQFTQYVTYGIKLLSVLSAKAGSTLPVKVRLSNAAGTNLSSATITLTVSGISPAWTPQPSGNFSYPMLDGGNGYQYNLQIPKNATAGNYKLLFTASGGDPITHSVTVTIPKK